MLEAKLLNALIYSLITVSAFFNVVLNADNNKSFLENATAILTHSFQKAENPCNTPLTYTIGTFDNRFGISQEEFKKAIEESAAVWNDAGNKKLFVYSPDGELKINLVYDARQEVEEKLQKLEPVLEEMRKKGDALEAKYDKTDGRAEKEMIKKQRDAIVDTHNGMIDDYNADTQKLGGMFSVGHYEEGEKEKTLDIYVISSSSKLKRLLVHELGHALGLEHSDNEGDIMYHADVATNEKPTVGDIVALGRLCGEVTQYTGQ